MYKYTLTYFKYRL